MCAILLFRGSILMSLRITLEKRYRRTRTPPRDAHSLNQYRAAIWINSLKANPIRPKEPHAPSGEENNSEPLRHSFLSARDFLS
jgi:hypothetical protein